MKLNLPYIENTCKQQYSKADEIIKNSKVYQLLYGTDEDGLIVTIDLSSGSIEISATADDRHIGNEEIIVGSSNITDTTTVKNLVAKWVKLSKLEDAKQKGLSLMIIVSKLNMPKIYIESSMKDLKQLDTRFGVDIETLRVLVYKHGGLIGKDGILYFSNHEYMTEKEINIARNAVIKANESETSIVTKPVIDVIIDKDLLIKLRGVTSTGLIQEFKGNGVELYSITEKLKSPISQFLLQYSVNEGTRTTISNDVSKFLNEVAELARYNIGKIIHSNIKGNSMRKVLSAGKTSLKKKVTPYISQDIVEKLASKYKAKFSVSSDGSFNVVFSDAGSIKDYSDIVKALKTDDDVNVVLFNFNSLGIYAEFILDNKAFKSNNTDKDGTRDVTKSNLKPIIDSVRDFTDSANVTFRPRILAFIKEIVNQEVQSSLKGNNMRTVQSALSTDDISELAEKYKGGIANQSDTQIVIKWGTSKETVRASISTKDKMCYIFVGNKSEDFEQSKFKLNDKKATSTVNDVLEAITNKGVKKQVINFINDLVTEKVQSSLKGGNMKSRKVVARASSKLRVLSSTRKVMSAFLALAEAEDKDEQEVAQEDVQDAVEELLENPTDEIEDAIEEITSAMRKNRNVILSAEEDEDDEEEEVDSEVEDDEDDEEEDDDKDVESAYSQKKNGVWVKDTAGRGRSGNKKPAKKKTCSSAQRTRNIIAELGEEEDDKFYDEDMEDLSDVDMSMGDETASVRGRKRATTAKVKSKKALASIVASNLKALR